MKEQQNNIKIVSFQNQQSKNKKRRNRRNKKYFFKRGNLRRKGERGNNSEDQKNRIISEHYQQFEKKIEKISQEFNKKITEQNDRINQQDMEIIKLRKKIKNQDNKFAISSEINNQSEKSSIKMKD